VAKVTVGTNNYAISLTDIASATKEAASMASNYGVSVEQLSALITMAVSRTRQSGSEAGTAISALLVNLSDITNKERMKAFDTLGISLYKMVDGAKQLKTPIEILTELSEVFNSLPDGDDKKNILLNDIGGRENCPYVQKCA
jgi:TP901 family phage tail tape measure protein